MRTYSLEQCAVRAYSLAAGGVQAVIDGARTLNNLTRPARRGADGEDGDAVGSPPGWAEDWDCAEDAAYDEPTISTARFDELIGEIRARFPNDEVPQWYRDGHERDMRQANETIDRLNRMLADDTPNPTEPGLDDSELVGVRGLLQERYDRPSWKARMRAGLVDPTKQGYPKAPNFAGAAASLADERFIQPSAGVSSFSNSSVSEDKQQDASDHSEPCRVDPADPQPQSSQPRCARCDSKLGEVAAVSDRAPGMFCSSTCQKAAEITAAMKQHPAPKSSAWSAGYAEPTAPAEPRTAGSGPSEVSGIPPSPSEGRQLPCASCNRATKLLDGVAVHTQDNTPVIDCGDKHPDDAVAEWIGGAVPVISKVLASHVPHERGKYHYVECVDPHGTHDFHLDDWVAWHAHVSPIIAEDLAQPPDALTRLGADYRCGLRYTVGVLQREAERLKALQLKYTDPTLYTHAISVVEKLLDAIDLELNLTTK